MGLTVYLEFLQKNDEFVSVPVFRCEALITSLCIYPRFYTLVNQYFVLESH